MKYARIRNDGVVELRQGGETVSGDIPLTDEQYSSALASETLEELMLVINVAAVGWA